MVVSGEHLFVLDSGTYNLPGSITEVNTATGKLIRVISGPSYELSAPDGIVLERGDLFISDSDLGKGGSVTEVNPATGKLVRVISGPAYQFDGPGPWPSAGRGCSC